MTKPIDPQALARLAPAQHELFLMLARGMSCKQAAEKLTLTPGSVSQKAHLIGQILGTTHRGLWMKLIIELGTEPVRTANIKAL